MGTFDYVKCDMPLPIEVEDKEFQTKDFDATFGTIIIKENGELFRIEYDSPEEVRLEVADNFEFEFYNGHDEFWATVKNGIVTSIEGKKR